MTLELSVGRFIYFLHFYLQRQDVLEAWKMFEEEHGTEVDVLKVQAMMPTPKKVRKQIDEFNQEEGS